VMLVLLVIFMVTAPLLQQGVDVELPEVEARPLHETKPEDLVVVTVDRKGRFSLQRGRFLDAEQLRAAVAERLARAPRKEAYVRGDRHVDYGRVVEAMVILQQAGVPRVGLITEPPEE
ncbi:MAG: ExbD/TolR family protein, partial [Gammaproteobacteria bacterium]